MFTKKITDSDAFMELSSAAQALYFHLNQGADDDGFNNQVSNAMFKAHASIDDLKILMAKNFIIRFESGVIVIKHWRMHNTLRKDRYTPTNFQEELRQLGVKDNGAYTLGCQMVAKRLPNGCHRLDKNSLEEIKERGRPSLEKIQEYCKQEKLKIDSAQFYAHYTANGWRQSNGNEIQDWKAAAQSWALREKTMHKKDELAPRNADDLSEESKDIFERLGL